MTATLFDVPAVERPPHPAKYSASVLAAITAALVEHLPDGGRVLDPFAGVGRVHTVGSRWWTVGGELEPEWAQQAPGPTVVADALAPPFRPGCFDAVVTSPTYGNRMADHHNARDGSRRHTYRHYLGRPLNERSSAGLQWGHEYRAFHERAWLAVWGLLRPGGLFVLNVSDHIRKGAVVPVAAWHRSTCEATGFELVDDVEVATPRQRHGENGAARVDCEHVFVLRRPASSVSEVREGEVA